MTKGRLRDQKTRTMWVMRKWATTMMIVKLKLEKGKNTKKMLKESLMEMELMTMRKMLRKKTETMKKTRMAKKTTVILAANRKKKLRLRLTWT
mmetsp:Transcript_58097/g.162900  ORF Transcript_58097/g.162900 Transcript_58097/m.162900 type:complete len:93 (-) Transcript_58097:60-338(-)